MVYQALHKLIDDSRFDEAVRLLQADAAATQRMAEEEHDSELPLHMALRAGAPDELVLRVLHANEDAAWWKGRDANLPLHIAVTVNASPDVVEQLIRANPRGLDGRNAAGLTPREIGHSDPCARHSVSRPTACWFKLLDDEEQEEILDGRLLSLRNRLDAGLKRIEETNADGESVSERLRVLEEKLSRVDLKGSEKVEEKLNYLETTFVKRFNRVENMLCVMENEIKSLDAKEYMAKKACEAASSEVRRIQKDSEKKAEALAKELNDFKTIVELDNRY